MFEHILVPLDGSHLAECSLPHVVALAHAFSARVTLLKVLLEHPKTPGPTRSVDPLNWHLRKAEASAYLDSLAIRVQKEGLRVDSIIAEGHAAEQIIEFARKHDVELIVMSSHGRSGLSGWNISSVVQKIMLRAYLPMMIVRAYQPTTDDLGHLHYRRLLVPLDGSKRAECALPVATVLARFHDSQLLLAHLVCRPEMLHRTPLTGAEIEMMDRITDRNQRAAVQYLEQIQSGLSGTAETCLDVSDNLTTTLHELVEREKVDLVILSAHGHTGKVKWPYGATALSFIVYGTTPLLVIQDLSPDQVEETLAEIAAKERGGH